MKTITIRFNPVLHLFFRELRTWLVNGMPAHQSFKKEAAICKCLSDWCDNNLNAIFDEKIIESVCITLNSLFERDYGERGFPFNQHSGRWNNERVARKVWHNIYRCAFVDFYSHRDNWLHPSDRSDR